MSNQLLQLTMMICVIVTVLSAFSAQAQHLYTQLDHGMFTDCCEYIMVNKASCV